jgi:hypothetical protein
MSIVTDENLIGHFRIAINKHETDTLQSFIDRFEKIYLTDLFGPTIYTAFKADLNPANPNTPNNTPFTTIFDFFQITDSCGQTFNCNGLLDMLKGFIYYHWNAENWLKKTASGTVVIDSENSTVRNSATIGLANYWNDAVMNYDLIQLYICQNIELFETAPEIKFTGIQKEFMPLT